MLAHGEEGHIVNTASLAGLMPGGGTYGVSKHGVLSLTETLQQNLTMQGAKIGASVLCPGFVNTNIFDAERNRPKELSSRKPRPTSAEMAEMGRSDAAAGKQPAEVADIVFRVDRGESFLHAAASRMGSDRPRASGRGAFARSADDARTWKT